MPVTIDFQGKLALVTGGGRGIGLGISRSLAKAGADVAITYTVSDSSQVAAALAKEHGVRVRAFRCDVTVSSQVDALVTDIEAEFGRKVDMAIANAGICIHEEAHEHTDEAFQSVLNTNLTGPFFLSRSLFRSWIDLPLRVDPSNKGPGPAVPDIKGVNLQKQILFVSSISGLVAMFPQRQAAYNASKGGLTMLAKSLAGEWAHCGVSVNSISPGYVETEMSSKLEPEEAHWPPEWIRRTPAGRFAQADEMGDHVVMVLQQMQKGWMTGADVVVDGGYTIF